MGHKVGPADGASEQEGSDGSGVSPDSDWVAYQARVYTREEVVSAAGRYDFARRTVRDGEADLRRGTEDGKRGKSPVLRPRSPVALSSIVLSRRSGLAVGDHAR